MSVTDLIKWNKDKSNYGNQEQIDPFYAMQSRMNQMIDRFISQPFSELSTGSNFNNLGDFLPRIDISETEGEILITTDMPGMDEKDVEINLEKDTLIISGTKTARKEEKGRHYHRIERREGSFRREIPLPPGVDADKVNASFKMGVLEITIPKPARVTNTRKLIPINK